MNEQNETETCMEKPITNREIYFGVFGALLSGFIVWLLSYAVEMNAQLVAIQAINDPLIEAVKNSATAQKEAEIALTRARLALDSARGAENEANRVLSGLNAGEVFARLDKELEGLRDIARKEVQRVVQSSSILTRVETGTCAAERGALDYKGRTERRQVDCRISFSKPFAEIPKVMAGLSELNTTGKGIEPGIRIQVVVLDVARDHATLRFSTWHRTGLYGVDATWIAVGR